MDAWHGMAITHRRTPETQNSKTERVGKWITSQSNYFLRWILERMKDVFYFIVLYCIVFYFIVFYCVQLYFIVFSSRSVAKRVK